MSEARRNFVSIPPPALPPTPAGAARETSRLIAHLERSQLFQDYARAFHSAFGLSPRLQPADWSSPPCRHPVADHPFYVLPEAADKFCPACLQLQRWHERGGEGESCPLDSFAGLRVSAVPIRLGTRVVGFLCTGPVSAGRPTHNRFQACLRQMRDRGPTGPVGRLRSAYLATPVLSPLRFESAIRLLTIFARHLALLGAQLWAAEISTEPPVITRLRRFISQHHGDNLTLAEVARVAHVSVFHFCRLFKQETGQTFKQYLAGIRIEAVKVSLGRRHVRITEAAFAAGFQSLSQFNRVFLHLVGESPSRYRQRLSEAAQIMNGPGRLAPPPPPRIPRSQPRNIFLLDTVPRISARPVARAS